MNAPTVKRAQRYLSVLVRWLVIGAVTFGLTVAAGTYITNQVLTKVYTASAVLQVPASELTWTAGADPAAPALQPEFVNTMMSPELLLGVVKELGLERRWAERMNKSNEDELPDVDALTRMARLVKIQLRKGTNLVEITAASDVPEEAAAIANAMASRYQTLRELRGPVFDAQLDPMGTNRARLVERADIPKDPTRPNLSMNFIVTLVVAGVLSLLVASFVEMVLLFIRAGEREES